MDGVSMQPSAELQSNSDELSDTSESSESSFGRDRLYALDFDEQRTLVAEDRWRDHRMWCEKQMEATRFSVHNRRIALKILVSEAFRLDRQYIVHNGGRTEDLQAVREKWRSIGREVMQEMNCQDNSLNVLRKLSSMSVFITGDVCRQYGENVEGRTRRLQHQTELLMELQRKGELFKQDS